MTIKAKLNGIATQEALAAALDGGAAYLGFILSPHPTLRITATDAGTLARSIPEDVSIVASFRMPFDAEIEDALAYLPLDYIQLTGNETPERVQEIRQQFGLPIIKSIPIASADDLATARSYEQAADFLLFTAKPTAGVQGISAQQDWPFDWSLLKDAGLHRPWFLGGGLTTDNIHEALTATGAQLVDITDGIASGGQSRPGTLCPGLITEMLGKVRMFSPILAPPLDLGPKS